MAFGIGGGMRAVGPAPRVGGIGGGDRDVEPVGPQPRMGGGGFDSFKRGGKVKKTGLIKAERGERVLTKKQQHERSEKKMGKR